MGDLKMWEESLNEAWEDALLADVKAASHDYMYSKDDPDLWSLMTCMSWYILADKHPQPCQA